MSRPNSTSTAPKLSEAQKQEIQARIGPFLKLGRAAVAERLAELGAVTLEVKDDQVLSFFRTFLRVSPKNYGSSRRPHWWRMMLMVFSRNEAIKHYLGQFDIPLTSVQVTSIKAELQRQMGLGQADAETLLEGRFSIRIRGKRDPGSFDLHGPQGGW